MLLGRAAELHLFCLGFVEADQRLRLVCLGFVVVFLFSFFLILTSLLEQTSIFSFSGESMLLSELSGSCR